jgi:hypothetical protein
MSNVSLPVPAHTQLYYGNIAVRATGAETCHGRKDSSTNDGTPAANAGFGYTAMVRAPAHCNRGIKE